MPSIQGEVRRRRVRQSRAREHRLARRDDEESDSGSEDDEAVSNISRPQSQNQPPTRPQGLPRPSPSSRANPAATVPNVVPSVGPGSSLALSAAGNRVLAQDDIEIVEVESDDDPSDDEEDVRVVLSTVTPVPARPGTAALRAPSRAPAANVQTATPSTARRPLATGQQGGAPPVFNVGAPETAAPAPAPTASTVDPQRSIDPQPATADRTAPAPTFVDTRLPQETIPPTQTSFSSATGVNGPGAGGDFILGSADGDEIRGHPFAIAFGTLSGFLLLAGVGYFVYRWRRRGRSLSEVPGKLRAWLPSRRNSTASAASSSSRRLWGAATSRGGTTVPASSRRAAAAAANKRTNSEMIDDVMRAAFDSEQGHNDMEGAVTDEKHYGQAVPPPPPAAPAGRKRTISAWVKGVATPRTARFPRSEAGFAQRYSRPASTAMMSEAPTMVTVSTNTEDEEDYGRPEPQQRPPSWVERPVSPVSYVERPRPSVAGAGRQDMEDHGPPGGIGVGTGYRGGDAQDPPAFQSAWSETQSDVSGGRSMFGSGWRPR